MVNVYKSKVDWWLKPLLLVPLVGCGFSIYAGTMRGDQQTLLVSYAALGAYAALFFGLLYPLRYVVAPDDLLVSFGLVKVRIAWPDVIAMELSNNALSSPAMSLDRIEIRYRKNQSERSIRISPPDRLAFLADCARASGQHRVDGERLVRS